MWCFGRMLIKSGCDRQHTACWEHFASHGKEKITVRRIGIISGESVCQLIDTIRHAYPEQNLTLVMDNAGHQRCKRVLEHAATHRGELLFLLAYSPNIIFFERLWKHLKKKSLKNEHFKDFAMFRAAIDTYLENLRIACQQGLESS